MVHLHRNIEIVLSMGHGYCDSCVGIPFHGRGFVYALQRASAQIWSGAVTLSR